MRLRLLLKITLGQTPKKRDSKVQNDLYENLEDADFYEGLDYDDQTQIIT